MSAPDITALLEPIAEDTPAGPDLEYDADFLALEQAAAGKPEQQFGTTVVPAEPPDWKRVAELGEALLARSKDLRVAVQLTRAWCALHGLPGLAAGCGLVHGLLDRFWDAVHPILDPDDGDPTMRMNALAALVDPLAGLAGVRATAWVAHRGHRVEVRQALRVLGFEHAGPDDEPGPSVQEVEGLLHAAASDGASNDARAAVEAANALGALLEERAGSGVAPSFRPLVQLLRPLADTFDRLTGAGDPADESAARDDGPQAVGAGGGGSGPIRSRDDALRALERVCEYLERHEPANPAPLLIRRAQRLMTLGFLDIIRDIAPEALGTVEHLAGGGSRSDA